MRFEYFKADFRTPIEEIKRQYHRLVLAHHPDRGGDLRAMQKVNEEWDWLKKHNYDIHEASNGAVYTDERQVAPDDVTERFATLINALIRLDGVGIEVCGSFIWLSGNTYEWRKAIKALGFRWARRKQMWYLAPTNYRRTSGEWSMDEIRAYHGSQVVTEGFIPTVPMLKSA